MRINHYLATLAGHQKIKCLLPLAHWQIMGNYQIRVNLLTMNFVKYYFTNNINLRLAFLSLINCSHFSQVSKILLPCTVVTVKDLKMKSCNAFLITMSDLGSPIKTIWPFYKGNSFFGHYSRLLMFRLQIAVLTYLKIHVNITGDLPF